MAETTCDDLALASQIATGTFSDNKILMGLLEGALVSSTQPVSDSDSRPSFQGKTRNMTGIQKERIRAAALLLCSHSAPAALKRSLNALVFPMGKSHIRSQVPSGLGIVNDLEALRGVMVVVKEALNPVNRFILTSDATNLAPALSMISGRYTSLGYRQVLGCAWSAEATEDMSSISLTSEGKIPPDIANLPKPKYMHDFTMKRTDRPGDLISVVSLPVVTESQPALLFAIKTGNIMLAAHQLGMHGESITYDHVSYTSPVNGCCMRVPAQVLIAERSDVSFWKDMTDYPFQKIPLVPYGVGAIDGLPVYNRPLHPCAFVHSGNQQKSEISCKKKLRRQGVGLTKHVHNRKKVPAATGHRLKHEEQHSKHKQKKRLRRHGMGFTYTCK